MKWDMRQRQANSEPISASHFHHHHPFHWQFSILWFGWMFQVRFRFYSNFKGIRVIVSFESTLKWLWIASSNFSLLDSTKQIFSLVDVIIRCEMLCPYTHTIYSFNLVQGRRWVESNQRLTCCIKRYPVSKSSRSVHEASQHLFWYERKWMNFITKICNLESSEHSPPYSLGSHFSL